MDVHRPKDAQDIKVSRGIVLPSLAARDII